MPQDTYKPNDYLIRQIFSDHRSEILRMKTLSEQQRSAAMMISVCKTAELGYNVTVCPNCGTQRHYISCNNRNCPCCQWPSQQAWIKMRENEVVPGIPYYHIILTVPHELNPLIQLNEKVLLGKLFSCSSHAVIDLCEDKKFLGAVPGIISVLHTWQQNLLPHYHIHMIVSGGGLSSQGQFVSLNDPSRNRNRQHYYDGGFFLPLAALTNLFRGKMMDAVNKLWRKKEMVVPDENIYTNPTAWSEFRDKLYTTKWVGKIVKTFNGNGNAIEYLARYTFRTAISNSRILAYDGDNVSFSVSERETGEKKAITLSAMDFIRRFLLHVLPKGLTRVRYYGFLSNAWKTRKLQNIHRLLNLAKYVPFSLNHAHKSDLFHAIWGVDISVCRTCGARLTYLPRGQPMP